MAERRPAAPASPGFGIRVISASIERQLEGKRSSTGTRKGCIARFRSRAVTRSARSPMTGRDGGEGEDKTGLPVQLTTGNRILLEDEILVAMMMRTF